MSLMPTIPTPAADDSQSPFAPGNTGLFDAPVLQPTQQGAGDFGFGGAATL